ncbi:TPA: SymE family type I addiction module toxin [Citrobacter farmeri]
MERHQCPDSRFCSPFSIFPVLLKSTFPKDYVLFLPTQSHLNGNWLEEVGFSTDTPVTVSVELGRLVIEPVKG